MCGIYYCNKFALPYNKTLRRRGPESWNEVHHPELGYFGHSLLTTRGNNTVKGPIQVGEGMFLYNGNTYNDVSMNDTEWIAKNLITDTVDDIIQFIKLLKGEYAFTYVSEEKIIFCTDHFGLKPLCYFNDDTHFAVASLADTLVHSFGTFTRCTPNKIYILDRETNNLSTVPNKEWNLEQTVNNWDNVWKCFEQSVKDRYNSWCSLNLSSGYDSGVIACAVNKFFTDEDCYYVYNLNEAENVMAERIALHNVTVIDDLYRWKMPKRIVRDMRDIGLTAPDIPDLGQNEFANMGDANIYMNMLLKNKKIILGGEGGDDIYSDYGHAGKHLRTWSKFGGLFPKNLHTVWPWHENSMWKEFYNRTEISAGFWGIEARSPLMCSDLVQSWLNTTHTLKNKEYKGWMSQYMQNHNYPFAHIKDFPKQGYNRATKQ